MLCAAVVAMGEAKICKDACIGYHPLPLAQTGNFFNWSGLWVTSSAVPARMTLVPLVYQMLVLTACLPSPIPFMPD